MKNTSEPQVLFRGRLVAHDYPERHAAAQISCYDDFVDGVPRDRIRYGDPRDRNPGGITYATREERIAYRIEERQRMLAKLAPGDVVGRAWVDNIFPHKDDPNDLIGPNEEHAGELRPPEDGYDKGAQDVPDRSCKRRGRADRDPQAQRKMKSKRKRRVRTTRPAALRTLKSSTAKAQTQGRKRVRCET